MRQFALTVEYECGKVVKVTNEPDLVSALNEFYEELKTTYNFNRDKGCLMPNIISASIHPILYTSIYKGEGKNE